MATQTLIENVFKGLKRIFASDVTVRRIGKNKFKVIDTYNTQAMGMLATNYLNHKYSAFFSTMKGGYGGYTQNHSGNSPIQRSLLFREYELMDQDPILASALDLYAEEATVKNENGMIVAIKSEDQEIKSILENLFYDILNIDFNLLHWTRNLVKYGDMFLKLDLAEKIGIVRVVPISPYYIERQEGLSEYNPYGVNYKIEGPILKGVYEDYEISHFRLLSDSNFLPYGKSMIEPARRIWKQLTLMEDAMLIHRIIRAPQKRMFKIDIGNLSQDDAKFYIQKISDQIKKVPYIDETTGDYNLQYNMQNLTEDFFIPTRGGADTTQIDTLPGLEYNAIEDVEYLKNKMMSALRIPKAFLGFDAAINSKSTLSQEDIRFARTIERIQKIIAAELKNLAIVHLFLQGFNNEDLANFELTLTSPSVIYEQEKLEIWKSRLEVSTQMLEQKMFGSKLIYSKIFGLSETERNECQEDLVEDTKFQYRLQQILEQGNDPKKTITHAGNNEVDDPARTLVADKELNGDKDTKGNQMGRPKEIKTRYGTDEHPLGRDPLGQTAMHKATDVYTSENKTKAGPMSSDAKRKINSISNYILNKSSILKENNEILGGSIEQALND